MNSAKFIARYDGSTDIDAWLCKAELIVESKKEKGEEVIPACLEGAAFAVYQRMSAAERADFSVIKTRLLAAFGMTPYDAFSLFQERRLSGDECAEVFAIDIARLGKHCGITDDTALACKFVSGLPIDVRKEVMLRMGRKPTLSAAVEASQVLLGGITKDNVETNDGFVGQVSGGRSGNQQVRRCFKCGGSNHLAPRCRTIICYGCGKSGHIARVCPNGAASGNEQGKTRSSQPLDSLPKKQ